MADLIDRQAAIDELSQKYIIIDNPHYIGYNAGLDEAERVIKALPPVQTEIIYCKDCLYKKICSWKNQGAEFCSFGERGKQDG